MALFADRLARFLNDATIPGILRRLLLCDGARGDTANAFRAAMFLLPKTGKRKKKTPKPLRRSRKAIAAKSVFKAHGDNPLKSYRRRFTDYQVMIRAEVARQARLRDRTSAEIAFCELLDDMRILYESEKIFLNGDRFILVDMYVKTAKVAFEIDGSAHDNQSGYDAGRDAWLLRSHGVKTVRISNVDVFGRVTRVQATIFKSLGMIEGKCFRNVKR